MYSPFQPPDCEGWQNNTKYTTFGHEFVSKYVKTVQQQDSGSMDIEAYHFVPQRNVSARTNIRITTQA